MTDRTYTVRGKQFVRPLIEIMIEAEMSMGDTVTIGDFKNSANILDYKMTNQLTGASVGCSRSNNQVTMTDAGINVPVIIYAVGLAA